MKRMNKSGIDIIDRAYFFLVAAGIADLITGNIHKGNYNPDPKGSIEEEFIAINTLPFRAYDVVHEGWVNINLFISDKDGNTDLSRFRKLNPAIQIAIAGYQSKKGTLSQKSRDKAGAYTTNEVDLTGEYLFLKIRDVHGPYHDSGQEVFRNHSIMNFRVKCLIEKIES